LGDGKTTNDGLPTEVLKIEGARAVAATGDDTCVVLVDASVWCWGASFFLPGADATKDAVKEPIKMPGIENATALIAGGQHMCALVAGGRVRCWGFNADGQLGGGPGDPDNPILIPVEVAGLEGATALAAGGEFTCALMKDGSVRCWGRNASSPLNAPVIDSAPVLVAGIEGATAVSAAWRNACALLAGGTVRCWGANDFGALGDGTTTQHAAPVDVVGVQGATAIAVMESHACAVVTGGEVQCWGSNDYGQLGDGTDASALVTVVAGAP
jgi:alpha-tubulin suppressor-like RCC1 family protein